MEFERYMRQMSLRGFGAAGQQALATSRVVVVGAGGLGSPALAYLAGSGVGTIVLVDFDVVDTSNLHRQIIHRAADVGALKTDSAARFVHSLNPDVTVELHAVAFTEANAAELMRGADVLIDGSDNFETRFLVNRACVAQRVPYVWGSVFQFGGQVSVFSYSDGPCYACVFPEAPPVDLAPSCAAGGVLGAVCGVIGSVQAVEAVKVLTGVGRPLSGVLWVHDVGEGRAQRIRIKRRSDCAVCGVRGLDVDRVKSAERGLVEQESAGLEIGVNHLRRLFQRDVELTLWDLRENSERSSGWIPGTVLFGPDAEPPVRSARCVVYCESGVRSRRKVQDLSDNGYECLSLEGGYRAWLRGGGERSV